MTRVRGTRVSPRFLVIKRSSFSRVNVSFVCHMLYYIWKRWNIVKLLDVNDNWGYNINKDKVDLTSDPSLSLTRPNCFFLSPSRSCFPFGYYALLPSSYLSFWIIQDFFLKWKNLPREFSKALNIVVELFNLSFSEMHNIISFKFTGKRISTINISCRNEIQYSIIDQIQSKYKWTVWLKYIYNCFKFIETLFKLNQAYKHR